MNISHTQNAFGFKGTDIVIMFHSTVPDATVGVGYAGKGSECIAVDTGEHYINTGTKAIPAWKLVTHA